MAFLVVTRVRGRVVSGFYFRIFFIAGSILPGA